MWKYAKYIVRSGPIYLRFFGRTYYCPLCGARARKFTPSRATPGQAVVDKYGIVSMGERPHYRCPWCNSSDKERLVWIFLERKTGLLAGTMPKSVLHVAPEKNTMRRLKAVSGLSYFAGDMFEGDERYSSGRYGDAVYLDITDLSRFEDDTFDAVICNHVLEHVPDDKKGMREIFRVLKPGGFAVLQTPVSRTIQSTLEGDVTTPEARLAAYGQADHVRIYQEDEYLCRLEGVGFSVKAWESVELLDTGPLIGANPKEKVYVATK